MNCFRSLFALSITLTLAASANAQTATSATEQAASRIKTASAIGAAGTDMFGEQTSFYSGSTEFTATDLSIPGNNGLAVALSRRLSLDTNRTQAEPGDSGLWVQYALGDWELDLPYMSGTYTAEAGWIVGGGNMEYTNIHARCSGPTTRNEFGPKDHADSVRWLSGEFWGGITLRTPDGSEQPVLFRNPDTTVPQPTDSSATKLVTSGSWYFTCLPALQSGQPGEGFVAHGPDGTKIYFDQMVEYAERSMSKYWRNTYSYEQLQELRETYPLTIAQAMFVQGVQPVNNDSFMYTLPDAPWSNPPSQPLYVTLQRQNIRIYPSRIVDRFGNTVEYVWTNKQLMAIRSVKNDPADEDVRSITLTYSGGRVATASDGVRTVYYQYDGADALSAVILPDASRWTYDASTLRAIQRYKSPADIFAEYDFDFSCSAVRKLNGGVGEIVIGHPSGAIGRFEFDITRHLRSDIAPGVYCNSPVYIGDNWEAYIHSQSLGENYEQITDQMTVPVVFDTLALKAKSISGPGITEYEWIYDYKSTGIKEAGIYKFGSRNVTITEPQGKVELVFGARFMINEGQLLESRRIEGNELLERAVNRYITTPDELDEYEIPEPLGLPLTYDQDQFGQM